MFAFFFLFLFFRNARRMHELVARPREIAAGLPDVIPSSTAHSVSIGSDDSEDTAITPAVSGSDFICPTPCSSSSDKKTNDAASTHHTAVAFASSAVSFTTREPTANPRRDITLVSSGTVEQGEGRVLIARPRTITAEEEACERTLPVRPREINATPDPSPPLLLASDTWTGRTQAGPRGLALPLWRPEFAALKDKAEEEVNMRCKHGILMHGYGAGKAYWDAYYSKPEAFADAYTREWYCSAETLCAHLKGTLSTGHVALDLGCGTSMVSGWLEDMGYAGTASVY
jgi:hypothetical protein